MLKNTFVAFEVCTSPTHAPTPPPPPPPTHTQLYFPVMSSLFLVHQRPESTPTRSTQAPLFPVCLFVHLFVCLSVCLSVFSVSLTLFLSLSLFGFVFVSLSVSVCMSPSFPPSPLSLCLPACLSLLLAPSLFLISRKQRRED